MSIGQIEHELVKRNELQRRINKLELYVARCGPRTPPEVQNELEDAREELAQLDARIAQLQGAPAEPAPQRPPGGVNKIELRRSILRHFDSERLELLCADINYRLEQEGRLIRISPALVGSCGLELVVQRIIDHLERCGQLAVLLDALRQEQPGIV